MSGSKRGSAPAASTRSGALVAGQVVHDDDVAGAQVGGRHALDVGPEDRAVDRAAEQAGRDHARRVRAATKVVASNGQAGPPCEDARGADSSTLGRHRRSWMRDDRADDEKTRPIRWAVPARHADR